MVRWHTSQCWSAPSHWYTCSWPANANAMRPLSRSLTASRVTGERASGGSVTICAAPGSAHSTMNATVMHRANLAPGVIRNLQRFTDCSATPQRYLASSPPLARSSDRLAVQDFFHPQTQTFGYATAVLRIGLVKMPDLALLNVPRHGLHTGDD